MYKNFLNRKSLTRNFFVSTIYLLSLGARPKSMSLNQDQLFSRQKPFNKVVIVSSHLEMLD